MGKNRSWRRGAPRNRQARSASDRRLESRIDQLDKKVDKLQANVQAVQAGQETLLRNDRRSVIQQLVYFLAAVAATRDWLPSSQQQSQEPQGRDVRVSGTLDHGIRGAGEPQVVQIRTAAIAGGPTVTFSLTVVPADPGEASQS